ncbi:MAG: [FeFe] hydrogenase H-cluster radical SAM maturase HydG [Syntrophobacterales bacterium]|nr:[FeFe] hydrogenase H-cluster radical SAM maturase HydG [Syntrophobacterales bacterium]
MTYNEKGKPFIDRDKLYSLIEEKIPTESSLSAILNKALKFKGLNLKETASLLRVQDREGIRRIMEAAKVVKEHIYGKRLVFFAPIYTGNVCVNNCLYCAFRRDNKTLRRKVLTMPEIAGEVASLLKEGHKRILLICGESPRNNTDYMCEAIHTAYSVREGTSYIRRINVELAPMPIEDFVKLKNEKIGTYVCFQETYDPVLYKSYHPAGTPKADYDNRVMVFDRAMEAGISDVGLGVLFGLADYRFEVLALMEHARHLEEVFGCGPHTISVPRIELADNAPIATDVPNQVSDEDFKKIVSIIRIALPYTGIILSTRENEEMRTEVFNYGVSQISAGSRTNPGAYSEGNEDTGSQFSLGDHRSLDQVISTIVDKGYIPSFCTGCYRKGRVGNDFMDLAKPGLIKEFCMPNAVFTFKEYLMDFASPPTKEKGLILIEKIVSDIEKKSLKDKMSHALDEIEEGKRDLYF